MKSKDDPDTLSTIIHLKDGERLKKAVTITSAGEFIEVTITAFKKKFYFRVPAKHKYAKIVPDADNHKLKLEMYDLILEPYRVDELE